MATATIDLEERVEELEDELESAYAQIEKALKALDDDRPEEAAEILSDLLQDEEGETTDEES